MNVLAVAHERIVHALPDCFNFEVPVGMYVSVVDDDTKATSPAPSRSNTQTNVVTSDVGTVIFILLPFVQWIVLLKSLAVSV